MKPENPTDRPKLVVLALAGLIYSVGIAYILPRLPNQLYGNDFFARWYASKMLNPTLSINRLTWLLILMTTAIPVLQHTVYAQFNSLVAFALALTYYGLCRQKYLPAGLVAFITPLVAVGAEVVYRFTLPVFLGLADLPLILTSNVEPV